MEFIKLHWQEILLVALATVEIAKRIAKMTETKKDDAIVEKVAIWLKLIAGLSGHNVKGKKKPVKNRKKAKK